MRPRAKKPRVERREAGVPSAKGFARRLASATVPGTTARVLPPSRLSALLPPPHWGGWVKESLKTRAQRVAGTNRAVRHRETARRQRRGPDIKRNSKAGERNDALPAD